MRILVDIVHPADMHFFRNAIAELQSHGHTVAVTAKPKDVTLELLENFDIPYTAIDCSPWAGSLRSLRMLSRDYKLWRFARRFKPDLLTAIGGIWAAQTAFVLRRPSVLWDDTEHHKFGHMAAWPFATEIHSPDCYSIPPIKKQKLYPGCHELAFLHPDRFTPDAEIVRGIGIDPDEKYCIVRFVGWTAQHDVGQHGFADNKKVHFVKSLAEHARVYITSETPLPDELEQYRLKIPAHLIHHVMAFASLCVGEGASMISESACLAVPGVYINTLPLGYLNMMEEHGLIRQTTDTDRALQMSIDLLTEQTTKANCLAGQKQLIAEKSDVTDYIVATLERFDKGPITSV